MLEPDTRHLLLDLLRPPDGWELGHAIGTTFTLDLQALLLAPLSFAMFDWAIDENGTPDPIAMLEALRRYSDRTTLFHQAGMIGLPAEYQPLLVHLETAVVGVSAPRRGIFHPKVWLLQFVREDEKPRYRFLNLSRNLTFDTSWDTVAALEGTSRWKQREAEPIGAFLQMLVEQAGARLSGSRQETVARIATDVANVRFERPEHVKQIRFHPIGLTEPLRPCWPLPEEADRTLVVSPFLGADTLAKLHTSDNDVLVTRPESVDEIGADAVPFSRVKVMRDLISDDELDDDEGTEEDSTESGSPTLRGLHAKAFAFEDGNTTHLFTGSANAGEAAFDTNVEFLVELRAPKEHLSIKNFLEQKGVSAFGDLLVDYTPADVAEGPDPGRKLEHLLEGVQQQIGAADLRAHVSETDEEERFAVELRGSSSVHLPDDVTEVHCWPITRGQGHQVSPTIGPDGIHARLGNITYDGLTSFVAFEVQATAGGHSDQVRFVVNAPLEGAPPDRQERVIARLLKNRDDLLRYLLFLLSGSGDMAQLVAEIATHTQGSSTTSMNPFGQAPLLETLLRALVRDPEKIQHVARLLDDLEAAGTRDEIAPEGLLELWAAIDEVHDEMTGESE